MKTLKLRNGSGLVFIVVDKLEAFGEAYGDPTRSWLQVAGQLIMVDMPVNTIVDQLYSGESNA